MKNALIVACFGAWYGIAPALYARTSGSAPATDAAPAEQQAERLFREARAALEAGDHEQACQKFTRSHELEPALGTLLGLAMCQEALGKLATAWAHYTEAHALAKRSGQAEREVFAADKVAELRPQLSTLLVRVAPPVEAIPGLSVRRDGRRVGSATFNLPRAVDGGTYRISAHAPGKRSWSTRVEVPAQGGAVVVEVPVLSEDAPPPALAASGPDAATVQGERTHAAPRREPGRDGAGSAWHDASDSQKAGVISIGVGALSLAVGAGFLVDAFVKHGQSKDHCEGNACSAEGLALRKESAASGDLATLCGLGGVVFSVGGAILYLSGEAEVSSQSSVVLYGVAAPGSFVALLGGQY